MHGLVVSVLILTNWLANELDDGSDLPYDPVIGAIITPSLSSILDNDIFHPIINCHCRQKEKLGGIVIGALLEAFLKGTVFYQTTTSYTNRCWYRKFLSNLLATWSLANSRLHIFLSPQTECTEVASENIKAGGHGIAIFSARHADLHLGDVLSFNIEGTICERNPTTFRQVVSAANGPTVLFSHQKITDMFTKMALNALSNSQSPKDPQLPPCDFLVYKPTTLLPESGYDVMYNCHNFSYWLVDSC
ncbi:hypothetical protein DSO57_1028574 [Entomophthora muscae]|uniref:Uncharacterized protein n=1 Tax=Entomophthora muscae TaxID=34485 RepID=A0ACC2S3Y0_9FUNG|nr:hypothetical protein DSO57_1028574 [Entomophthora muscae]